MKTVAFLRLLLFAALSLLYVEAGAKTGHHIFYTLNRQNGLSDNNILQMIQLRDGRLAIYTEKGINVYSGQHFDFVPMQVCQRSVLPLYNGETHLYLDHDERLWIKHKYGVTCVDLQRLKVVPSPLDSLSKANGQRRVEDLYIDRNHDIWTVSGRTLHNIHTGVMVSMPKELGPLQDLDVLDDHLYMFFGTGKAADYALAQQKTVNVATAYGPKDAALYYRTSLIVGGPGRMFYQMRTSDHETIFLSYNTQTHVFTELYRCPIILNTLNVTPDNTALICSSGGYLLFDLNRGASCQEFSSVRLPDGTTLSTGINTIYPDQQKGVWLGTYHKGLLYASSFFNLFDTKTIDIPVTPILKTVYVNGKELQLNKAYNGRILLNKTPPYLQHLRLDHDQRILAFSFCTMNYVRPRSTFYRFRIDGGTWRYASAEDRNNMVNDRGVLYLPFTDLAPGDHRLEVQASTTPRKWSGRIRTIHITVAHPWWEWATWGAAILLASSGIFLLIRIKGKGGKATTLLSGTTTAVAPAPDMKAPDTEDGKEETSMALQSDFLLRAEKLVIQHISDTDYGVEQLATDLCMERTGLYKKITALTGDTPVSFIRNLRLDHATRLLREGQHTVNETACLCGFSSPSYFTKCFKQKFGIKPSEYIP